MISVTVSAQTPRIAIAIYKVIDIYTIPILCNGFYYLQITFHCVIVSQTT